MRRLFDPAHPWQLVLGLSVWALCFVAAYAAAAVACEAVPADALTWLPAPAGGPLVVGLLGVTAALLWAALRCWRAARRADEATTARFVARLGTALYGWAAAGTVSIALPVLLVPSCV